MGDTGIVPAGLAAAGSKLWRSITADYDVEEHEHLLLLEACRVADRLDRLAMESAGAPLTVKNFKGDEVANPLLVETRQQGIVLARLLASLRLPTGDEDEALRRPQRRGGARGT
ncbi:hypothetical protein ACQP04_28115 [Pseudonocardia halophobica]|uniref:hypothetical protein n=1 Tax=Pseudonocardia halophobica TaxID=29401 RepID=UPI003D9232C1